MRQCRQSRSDTSVVAGHPAAPVPALVKAAQTPVTDSSVRRLDRKLAGGKNKPQQAVWK